MSHSPASARVHRVANLIRPGLYLLLFAVLAAAVLPFFLLIHYAHPSADDFCYAAAFRHGDLWGNIKGEYLGWKGRYSAIFLTAAYHQPGGMLLTYGYALLLFLAALFAALYAFVRSLVEGTGTRLRTLFLTLGLGALYLGTMPKVAATVYWLDGAFQYQTGGIFTLLALAALFTLYRTGAHLFAWLACACIFVAIGATETAMITLVTMVLLMTFSRMFVQPQARTAWAAVLVVTLLSSGLLVLAPGNFARAEFAAPEAGRFWFSFSHAWFHGGRTFASWLANPGLWLATAVFIPAALRMVQLENVRRDASWPRFVLILALLPGLTWLFHFALWWAAATNPPGRMLNMAYLLFLAGWFTAVLEGIALAARRCTLLFTEELFPVPLRLGTTAAAALLAVVLLSQGHVRTAYADLLYRAPDYDQTMRERYARIAQQKAAAENGRPAMTFQAVREPPGVLMYSDIQSARNWRNSCFARYFGLETVRRQ